MHKDGIERETQKTRMIERREIEEVEKRDRGKGKGGGRKVFHSPRCVTS